MTVRYQPEGEHVVVVNPYEARGERVVLARNLGDDPLLSGPLSRLELRSGIRAARDTGGSDAITSPHAVAKYVSAMKGLEVGNEIVFSLSAQNKPNHVARLYSASVRDILATVLLTNGIGFIVALVTKRADDPDEVVGYAERLEPVADLMMVKLIDVVMYGAEDVSYVSWREATGAA